MLPNTIWQGTDKGFIITHDYADMPSATEVEIYINTVPQIIKRLTEGEISGVTGTSMSLAIDDADTVDKPSGEYEIQARITLSGGSTIFGRMEPKTVTIKDSIFTSTT